MAKVAEYSKLRDLMVDLLFVSGRMQQGSISLDEIDAEVLNVANELDKLIYLPDGEQLAAKHRALREIGRVEVVDELKGPNGEVPDLLRDVVGPAVCAATYPDEELMTALIGYRLGLIEHQVIPF